MAGQAARPGPLTLAGRLFRSPHDREILRLAVPALGALAADPLVALIDTVYMGRIGAAALGAVAVAGAVFSVAVAGLNFLAYGTTPLVAGRLGAGDMPAAGRMAGAAVAVALGAGAVLTVVLLAFPGALLGWLGASGDLLGPGVTYLRIRAVGLVAVLLITAASGVFRGAQDAVTPFRAVLVLNAVNLVLDPVLIFGLDWGVAGAAWSTVAGQVVGAALLVRELRRPGSLGFTPARPRRDDLRELATAGGKLVLRTFGLLAVFTAATAVAARLGTEQVAAHQVASELFLFLALALDAVAIAAQSVVGKAVGEGDKALVRSLAGRVVVLGSAAGVAIAVLLVMVSPWLGGWFTSDPVVVAALASIYGQLVLVQVLGGAVFAWDGVVIGATDFTFAMVATVAPAAVTLVWLGGVWALEGDLAAVWWGMVLLMALRLVTLAWWHRRRLA